MKSLCCFYWGIYLLLAGLYLAASTSLAADSTINPKGGLQSKENADQAGVLSSVGGAVDGVQQQASERFNRFVIQLDDFFSADEAPGEVNKSWARLRLDTIENSQQDLNFKASVKLRIVLPRAQQRFRLLLSSDDDGQSDSDGGASDVNSVSGNQSEDRNVSLALRFIRTARKSSSLNFDLGVRARDQKVQLFARISATNRQELGSGWTSRISNDWFHYSSSGYENKLRFDFRRQLFVRGAVFFRTSTGFNWRKGRKGAGIGETLGVYSELSPTSALAVEALASYSTALNGENLRRYEGAELRLRFRQNIWRPWFFYEVWPTIYWPSTNDYEPVYGGLIRIEVVIGQL